MMNLTFKLSYKKLISAPHMRKKGDVYENFNDSHNWSFSSNYVK